MTISSFHASFRRFYANIRPSYAKFKAFYANFRRFDLLLTFGSGPTSGDLVEDLDLYWIFYHYHCDHSQQSHIHQ